MVREDAPDDKRLVAYLSANNGRELTIEDLRQHLKAKLPEYMLPSAYVLVDELPLLPTGKVDRRALPSTDGTRPRMMQAYAAPRNRLERLLADLWQEIFGVEQVGIRGNFFELGGDSMRAAILINRLQQRLGDYIYVVALFEAPTIAALAAYLTEHYASPVAKVAGDEESAAESGSDEGGAWAQTVNADAVARVRELIGTAPAEPAPATKNPPAIFILSPPRSGSTLLRVMLAGHPSLFAPPELELLSFNTLAERREALTGKYSFWMEGTIRAVMELKGCEMEERGLSVPQFYRLMQDWLGERRLVDKTPSYALDKEVLRRAEACFDGALYIHQIGSAPV